MDLIYFFGSIAFWFAVKYAFYKVVKPASNEEFGIYNSIISCLHAASACYLMYRGFNIQEFTMGFYMLDIIRPNIEWLYIVHHIFTLHCMFYYMNSNDRYDYPARYESMLEGFFIGEMGNIVLYITDILKKMDYHTLYTKTELINRVVFIFCRVFYPVRHYFKYTTPLHIPFIFQFTAVLYLIYKGHQ